MDATGPTLLRRAQAVLQAKQHLVFYAIPVYALAAIAPLLASWLHDGGSVDEILARVRAPLYDSAAAPGVLVVTTAVAYLVLYTWFRAGLIRSIVGNLHLRPRDGTQFVRLFSLHVLIELVDAAAAWTMVAADSEAAAALLGVALLSFNVVVLYADYAIVITGVGPLRAVARSWACVRANALLSPLLVLVVTVIATTAAALLAQSAVGGLMQAAPLLVVYVVVMGVVTFVADVVLVVAYVLSVETGALPRAR